MQTIMTTRESPATASAHDRVYAAYCDRLLDRAIGETVALARGVEARTNEALFEALDAHDPAVFDLHAEEKAAAAASADVLDVLEAVRFAIAYAEAQSLVDALRSLRLATEHAAEAVA